MRFAVPFFFVISGYFWGTKVQNGHSIDTISTKMIFRLLFLFLIWSFIYFLPCIDMSAMRQYGVLGPIKIVYWSLVRLTTFDNINVLFEGTKVHLWFLTALIYSISLSYFCIKRNMHTTLVIVALALYVVGMLAGSYSHCIAGVCTVINTRNGPFLGTLFFVSGYYLSTHKPTCRWLFIGTSILAFGIIIQFAEVYLLYTFYGVKPDSHDYVFGTYLMGMGVSMMALSNHNLFKYNTVSGIGKFTLGIYLVHFIYVDLLRPISELLLSPIWELVGYPLIVFCASLISVFLLSKVKYVRYIVS